MSQSVFGAAAAVTMLNRAFNNSSPANAVFNNQVATAGTTAASHNSFAMTFGASFPRTSLSDAQFAERVLGNMGVLPNDALLAAVAEYLTAYAATDGDRGLVVLQLGQILAGMENATGDQAVYAPQAVAWNKEVEQSFIYSSNTANTSAYVGDFAPTPVDQGQTFTLTTGADNIVGTGGNDTVTASVVFDSSELATATSTLTAADSINGGVGTDIINLVISGAQDAAVSIPAASITGVETLNVRNTVAQTASLDASTVAGLTAFNADRSIGKLAVTNLAAGASVGVIGDGTAATGAVDFAYASAAPAVTINVSGGTKVGAIITNTNAASAVTTAVINSTGAANTVGVIELDGDTVTNQVTSLTVNAASNLTATLEADDFAATAALTVTGAAASVNLGVLGNFKTIDASGLTAGGLTVALGTNTTSFKGGVGNDVVTTAVVATTVASAIDAGAGSADRLIVNASTEVDTAAEAKVYSGFDVLQAAGMTVDASLFTNSTITALRTSGATTFNNVNAAQAANVTVTATAATPTINVTGAATVGQLDTVSIDVNDGAAAVSSITLADVNIAGVETLNLKATDNVIVTALTGATALTNLTATGAGSVNITTGALALNVNSVLDATAATGAVTIDATAATTNGVAIKGTTGTTVNTLTGSAQADSITGGAGNDVLSGLAGNDTINAGAGNDSITGGTGADVINVGEGVDTILMTVTGQSFAGASITSGTTALTGIDKVTGMAAGDIISLAGILNTFTGSAGTTIAAATGTTVSLVRGNFVDSTSVFTADAAGTSTLVVYDADGAGAGTAVEAIILVGTAGVTGTAAAGVLTLA